MIHKCQRSLLAVLIVTSISTTLAQVGSFPGDFSYDGHIDLTDFATFAACLAGPGISEAACADGDFDWDDDVDLHDARRFLNQFNQDQCTHAPFTIDTYAVGNAAVSIELADMNSDGRLDAVVGSFGGTGILFGNGDGTLQPFLAIGDGAPSYPLAILDADDDGRLDVAAVTRADDLYWLTLFLGDGGVSFIPGLTFILPISPLWIRAEDLNGDGKDDIVTRSDSGVYVLLNIGNGNFFDPVTSDVGNFARIALGDVDSDGDSDLIGSGFSMAPLLTVSLNDGGGSFVPLNTYEVTAGFHDVAVGDVNNDGALDIAIANFSFQQVQFLMGMGDGTFSWGSDVPTGKYPSQLILRDFDHDFQLDIAGVTNEGITILLNEGAGIFGERLGYARGLSSIISHPVLYFASGDLNGDGHIDLVATGLDEGFVGVLRGRGDGRFRAPGSVVLPSGDYSEPEFRLGDFDQDGDDDVASVDQSTLSVLQNRGDGWFRLYTTYGENSGGRGGLLDIVDLNNDGDPDVLTNHASSNLYVYLGNEDLHFDDPLMMPLGDRVRSWAPIDYNHDAIVDLVTLDAQGLHFWPGMGNGTFSEATLLALVGHQMIAADLNHDTHFDFVVLENVEHQIEILMGTADATFVNVETHSTISNVHALSLVDISMDDMPDILVKSHNALDIHFALGGTHFAPGFQLPIPESLESFVVADVDRDTRQDLIIIDSNAAYALFGLGGGALQTATPLTLFDGMMGHQALAAVDLENDGDLELIMLNIASLAVAPNLCIVE